MRGVIALVGAGEFLPEMADLDRELLATIPSERPRVAIVPTASFPDGERIFRDWGAMGADHFAALGCEVEQVLIRERIDAEDDAYAQALGEADLIYFSGGKPGHLRSVLAGSPAWRAVLEANARGAVIAGCSAGAMVLCASILGSRRRRLIARPFSWQPGLGVVPRAAVLPHYDRFPEPFMAFFALQAPHGVSVLGIDEQTALVGRDQSWQVRGRSQVTVWRGRHRERHRAGDTIRL